MSQVMSIEEATTFFADLYFGEHHIPSKIFDWGHGWMVKCDQRRWSTYDWDHLTRFVLLCHERSIRGEIQPHTFNSVKVIIHKRQREHESFSLRHPDIHDAIERFQNEVPYTKR